MLSLSHKKIEEKIRRNFDGVSRIKISGFPIQTVSCANYLFLYFNSPLRSLIN